MTVAAGPFIGFGSDLQDSATSGSGYVTVGHIIDIDTPDQKAGDVDTSYVQQANAVKTFIAKLIDPGAASFKLIWTEAGYSHIQGLLRTPYFFKIIFPDTGGVAGSNLTFTGYYSELSAPLHLEDLVVCEVKIKVSGSVTTTLGS